MEGLLLADVLERLRVRLPAGRGTWRFLDAHTHLLPLEGGTVLWLVDTLPHPRLALRTDLPDAAAGPHTAFQAQLRARATGPLARVEQPALDRVARLHFAADEGFAPTPPVILVAELTGRNGNLILVDDAGTVLGASRIVGADVNRYRTVVPGAAYVPPPPYAKPDPRTLAPDALADVLRGATLTDLKRRLDGIGPELTGAVRHAADVPPDATLEGDALDAVVAAVHRVAADPTAAVAAAGARSDVAADRRRDRRARDRKVVEADLRDKLRVARKRERDAERALAAADDAARLRGEADLLLAHAHAVPTGASRVTLPAFEGGDATVDLDPARSVAANAERRYDQARRREARAERALAQADARAAEIAALEADLAALDEAGDDDLAARAAALAKAKRPAPRLPGARFDAPHGFTVVVGRNARENDAVTFRVARSLDVWLHAQGWTGSHVVILAGGREVPFDVVLFAAQLAAAYSKAAGGDNVPVDYTLRKHVWKVKGGPPGAVRFTQQKTVYVTPDRNPGRATSDAS